MEKFIKVEEILSEALPPQNRASVAEKLNNGSMEFEARMEALKQFKEASQILISTDAAGESLNMQFAYIVINYDMPC